MAPLDRLTGVARDDDQDPAADADRTDGVAGEKDSE